MTATVPTLTECPFCGGKAMLHPDGWVDGSWPFVECLDCHADSPCARTDAEAIANWNRRASRSGGVVVPRELLERAQVLAETCAECGMQAYYDEDQKLHPTPNGKLHRELSEQFKALLTASGGKG
jgi:Lar family restriction alleviation protein